MDTLRPGFYTPPPAPKRQPARPRRSVLSRWWRVWTATNSGHGWSAPRED